MLQQMGYLENDIPVRLLEFSNTVAVEVTIVVLLSNESAIKSDGRNSHICSGRIASIKLHF